MREGLPSGGDVPSGGADREPQSVAAQASPQRAAFGGGDGSIALGGERSNFGGIVRSILSRDGEFSLACSTVLNVVV